MAEAKRREATGRLAERPPAAGPASGQAINQPEEVRTMSASLTNLAGPNPNPSAGGRQARYQVAPRPGASGRQGAVHGGERGAGRGGAAPGCQGVGGWLGAAPRGMGGSDWSGAAPGGAGAGSSPWPPLGILAGLALALALGATAPAWADDQTAVAIYQHLVETAPGQFDLRALSVSVATGPTAGASVATISDKTTGTLLEGISFAAAGPENTNFESMLVIPDSREEVEVYRENGTNVQFPPKE